MSGQRRNVFTRDNMRANAGADAQRSSGGNGNGIFTENPDWVKLFWSVLIDLIGALTYLVPGFGELIDVFWAPVQAYLVSTMYGFGPLTALSFFEEILPGTDFIPTATIGWVSQHTNVVPYFSDRMSASQGRRGAPYSQ
ncbi:hypothetical protein SARC_02683 [Sphaeroforma arctica JP610]|uniref:Uncharacterized protein n=1 Tax=Sphaeroforma arctica JP610 TaxID=667725 RepID=A0A0L0GA65_9EUKA|nr:hypothetical protein SARC_02683 [Sphaeroforma arctica JP610]KNC85128.1 hypothetical protein SARC_02683 [Sphaeroforma arctica JP610]|eukprot:XP_014159030.1 hypothetical protein SARC_02683 [Sphaeroforma arctica JP610]